LLANEKNLKMGYFAKKTAFNGILEKIGKNGMVFSLWKGFKI